MSGGFDPTQSDEMPPIRVLVVEDDEAISDVTCRQLAKFGYVTEAAFSGTEAKRLLEAQSFDLVITDLMLPGLPGEEVVELVHGLPKPVPIIVISARSAASDKVDLLALGADDYLTKPFDLDEFIARVQVQLRHAAALRAHDAKGSGLLSPPDNGTVPLSGESPIVVGRWVVAPEQRTLLVNGEAIALTRTEFDIAALLAQNPRRVFTKQALYEHLWNEPYGGQEHSVSTHVSNLRAKLKPTGTDGYIQTVWGLGFKLDVTDGS